ncbi:hypothetical protein [Immundisolibacter sp.]|uniref:hypothetical protein n=1 Tax=Immundisolibacter sp. TaxID=1934948 RepID=UPI00262DDC83|nr:hypothetical protein [Immundisolibacter sp.]MDD3650925.1 hypothetical protein [Immundisolibacter sp.]
MEPGFRSSPSDEAQREARDRAVLRTCLPLPAALLLVTAVYATVRYVVFGPWPVGHIPIYVFNKAVSWTALTLLALALSLGPAARLWPARFGMHLWRRRYWGLIGFVLATVHILLSLATLNYAYQRAFFRQAFEFTPIAEFAMLCGALTWLVLLAPLVASLPGVRAAMSARYWGRLQAIGRLALVLVVLHLSYAVAGWFVPAQWPGGLPPITLWSALTALLALGLRVAARLRFGPGDMP